MHQYRLTHPEQIKKRKHQFRIENGGRLRKERRQKYLTDSEFRERARVKTQKWRENPENLQRERERKNKALPNQVLYIAADIDRDIPIIKVGITSRPKQNFHTLKRGNAFIRYLKLVNTLDARTMELEFGYNFHEFRVYSEQFRLTKEVFKYIDKMEGFWENSELMQELKVRYS